MKHPGTLTLKDMRAALLDGQRQDPESRIILEQLGSGDLRDDSPEEVEERASSGKDMSKRGKKLLKKAKRKKKQQPDEV